MPRSETLPSASGPHRSRDRTVTKIVLAALLFFLFCPVLAWLLPGSATAQLLKEYSEIGDTIYLFFEVIKKILVLWQVDIGILGIGILIYTFLYKNKTTISIATVIICGFGFIYIIGMPREFPDISSRRIFGSIMGPTATPMPPPIQPSPSAAPPSSPSSAPALPLQPKTTVSGTQPLPASRTQPPRVDTSTQALLYEPSALGLPPPPSSMLNGPNRLKGKCTDSQVLLSTSELEKYGNEYSDSNPTHRRSEGVIFNEALGYECYFKAKTQLGTWMEANLLIGGSNDQQKRAGVGVLMDISRGPDETYALLAKNLLRVLQQSGVLRKLGIPNLLE